MLILRQHTGLMDHGDCLGGGRKGEQFSGLRWAIVGWVAQWLPRPGPAQRGCGSCVLECGRDDGTNAGMATTAKALLSLKERAYPSGVISQRLPICQTDTDHQHRLTLRKLKQLHNQVFLSNVIYYP